MRDNILNQLCWLTASRNCVETDVKKTHHSICDARDESHYYRHPIGQAKRSKALRRSRRVVINKGFAHYLSRGMSAMPTTRTLLCKVQVCYPPLCPFTSLTGEICICGKISPKGERLRLFGWSPGLLKSGHLPGEWSPAEFESVNLCGFVRDGYSPVGCL